MSKSALDLAMYRTLVHEIPEAAALSQLEDGLFLEVNRHLLDLFGYHRDEVVGQSSLGMPIWTDPLDRGKLKEALTHNREGRDCLEFNFRRNTGSPITCLLSARRIDLAQGQYILSILKDITPYRKTMQELEDSRERFRVLHEASFGGISVHDKGIILEANSGLAAMTGYGLEELIGMDGLLLIAEDSRPLVRKHIIEHYERPYEVQGRRKDGTLFPMVIQGKQIPYQGKSVRVTEFRDIGDQKRQEERQKKLEDQMVQVQKMDSIGVLAGGIAHDFNNILTVIIGHADLLVTRMDVDSPALKSLGEIQKAALYAAELTQNLLAFSRKQVYEPRVIDLNRTVTGFHKILTRLISEDIKIGLHLGEGRFPILADAHQIEQILVNLVINARDAINATGKPGGKTITIETEKICLDQAFTLIHPGCRPGDHVMLSVSDEGTGMDQAIQQRIFEPFFTTKEQGKGTGLGLSTVYGIVQQNEGFITVYSEVGSGTVFKIYWPFTTKVFAATGSDQQGPDTLYGTETVLLVEDDPRVRDFAQEVLTSFGYTVRSAENGSQALGQLRAGEKTDLVISDVIMPGMNGPEFVDQALKTHPGLRVLFVSGYSANYISQKGIVEGTQNFLQKPYTATTLAQKVRDILDRKPQDGGCTD